jgi:NAD(P)H-hydrate repair Nnr-like enzyme with NAD(P)H-hydrate epimerase domain
MQRAGAAIAEQAQQLLCSATASSPSVLILAGPGNNGGDALEAACLLEEAGIEVSVQLHADEDRQPADARRALARARGRAGVHRRDGDARCGQSWALVIDGLFGIGLTRPPGPGCGRSSTTSTACAARCCPSMSPAASMPTPAASWADARAWRCRPPIR